MAHWREQIARWVQERGLKLSLLDGGIGIEFPDGCDAFWILPGEVTSSVPLDRDEIDADLIMSKFDRVAELRRKTLHVIAHHLANSNIAFDRSPNGTWPLVLAGGFSTTLDVGPTVTAGALQSLTVHQIVARCFENYLVVQAPSESDIDRYLAIEAPPSNERRASEAPDTKALFDGLRGIVRLLRVCDAVKNEANLLSPEKLKAAATGEGPISAALLRVAETLPDAKATLEATTRHIMLEFDDKLASFAIDPKSRELAVRICESGSEAAGDSIASEYLRLNRTRSVVLNAVKYTARNRGWKIQSVRTFSGRRRWYLGSFYRDVALDVGQQLTDLLRDRPVEQAIRELLTDHPDFADECIGQLVHGSEQIELKAAELSPFPPKDQPALRELDNGMIREIDAKADAAINQFFDSKRAIYEFDTPGLFDLSGDAWATVADWVRLAEKYLDREIPDASAVGILLAANDPRGEKLAMQFLERVRPHHEVGGSAVELAWRFRHQIPQDVAREWFCPRQHDQVPFAKTRAKLGDPVALRFLREKRAAKSISLAKQLEAYPDPLTLSRMSDREREKLHDRLVTWAKTSWNWPLRTSPMRWALALGMTDVAEALDENPFLVGQMLLAERRFERLDEPGIFLSSDLFLSWSRLKPTTLMARLIATALTTDIVGEAAKLAEIPSETAPQRKARRARTILTPQRRREMYERMLNNVRHATAVAWKRWRKAKD